MRAVYIVSPTYYGVAADLESIAEVTHDHTAYRLLVDEAWGPHFHFHPALPIDALAAGADHVHQLDAQDARQFIADGDVASDAANESAWIGSKPS